MDKHVRQAAIEYDRAELLEKLIGIGAALSSERDRDRLFERILLEAMHFCGADGGTLYVNDHQGDAVNAYAQGPSVLRQLSFEP